MLIPKITASSFVSLPLSPCMLIPKITASSFVFLHLSPCMLIPKITASSFVSLHLSPCMLIPNLPACWLPKSLPLLVSLLHLSPFICLPACWLPKSLPLLVSLLHLSPFICLPAYWFPKSPFFICLPSFVSLHADSQNHRLFSCLPSFVSLHADSQNLPSSFVSLHLFPCMLITEIAAAPSLPSSFVSLQLSPCMLIPKISLLHLSPFIPQIAGGYRGSYFSKIGLLISTIAKWSWCRCRLVSLHLSPCMISILGCSWLPLPPCLPSFVLSPFIALHVSPSVGSCVRLRPRPSKPFICLPTSSGMLSGVYAGVIKFHAWNMWHIRLSKKSSGQHTSW